jgi:adenosylmethionine-8-amino-7-oxononanoate aminotransferase
MSFWHPFADMSVVRGRELVFDRGEGVWLWDEDGRRYLDATASLWYCNVGHGRTELAEAAATQLRRLDAYYTYATFSSRPALELAERVCSLVPLQGAAAFFTSGGSEAIDTAAKLVRRYWNVIGQPRRRLIVVREGAYHGMAAYGTSLSGIPANSVGYGDLVAGVITVPRDDVEAFGRILDEHEGEVAAFFGEPVIGAGGVYPPGPEYWARIERLCRERDVLLVLDEVVTGFGRLGTWFAAHRYGVVPDLVVGAKGITSGYVPLGVVAVGPRVQEPFWNGSAGMFRHGYTYSGHTTACAVALTNLDIVEREALLDRVAMLEPVLAGELGALADHSGVKEVRATGLVAAVELAEPALADAVAVEARQRGVLTRVMVGHSLQISPPFVITEEEIRFMAGALRDALDAVSPQAVAAAAR